MSRKITFMLIGLLLVGAIVFTACGGTAPVVEQAATEPPVQGPLKPPYIVSSETTVTITVNPWACPAGPEFVASNGQIDMTNIFNNQVVGTITLLGNTLIAKADGHHKEIPLAQDSYEVSVMKTNVLSDGNGEVFITNYTIFVCDGQLFYLGEREPIIPQTDA